jgi:hypothetical protein
MYAGLHIPNTLACYAIPFPLIHVQLLLIAFQLPGGSTSRGSAQILHPFYQALDILFASASARRLVCFLACGLDRKPHRLKHRPHQCTRRLAIWPTIQIEVAGRVLKEPVGASVCKFVSVCISVVRRRTYQSGRTSVTVRIYGLVVSTNSLKITHSGCVSRPHDGCSATTYHNSSISKPNPRGNNPPDCP